MTSAKERWNDYVQTEIAAITPLLASQDITLEAEQPHVSGERFLMSGQKVVLIGREASGKRVVIKTSAEPTGRQEIEAERRSQQALQRLPFAYHPLLAPKEMWHLKKEGRVIVVMEFIEQPQPYLTLPIIEQFDLILQAFTMLAGVHATTTSHAKLIGNIFGIWGAKEYQDSLQKFIVKIDRPELHKTLSACQEELQTKKDDLERYCGFLTHDDFALHNFRFRDSKIYLIDQSSLRFGNKHESWARFMNYMLLYNRDLERALLQHLEDNAAPEELRSLRLLRIYKAVELITYHHKAAQRSDGNTKALSERRVIFWHHVLQDLLENRSTKDGLIEAYKHDRDTLRSEEEVARQKALQQLV